ncbi:hypothetical protein HYH02_007715 [Chlamydomonas schloesseri]|uniref:Uncharacterized protein n=1 Tax=Chlamydomonas schloesseri TaxID=2026947 RepID=A0A835WH15_9CHLO|nr:hypothetical protein HYH02_007715 [Chlamydomonas schloesseri]|eukprot:KAG2447387.1 hypothetical protein HYH02_007715 [Chlamydomonas schloesseri]
MTADFGLSGSAATTALLVEAGAAGSENSVVICEVAHTKDAIAGVYDPVRHHLYVANAEGGCSSRLWSLPESHALLCQTESGDWKVLLVPEGGATLIPPRENSGNPSEIRARPPPPGGSAVVAHARGNDPYTTLLAAANFLAEQTGATPASMRTYILPLLDVVNRIRFNSELAALPKSCILTAGTSLTVQLEQSLLEGITVQAGPGCAPKPLLQAPTLRISEGAAMPLGVRYSGLSVVYGAATDNVLSVIDSATALKMAPAAAARAASAGSAASAALGSGTPDADATPAGVSSNSSATPTPPISRSNSGAALGNGSASAAATAAVGGRSSLSACPSMATFQPAPQPPALALSGRSITAAPIINIIVAGSPTLSPCPSFGGSLSSSGADGSFGTPTGARARVMASFALVGIKTQASAAAGRDTAVRACRVMPSVVAVGEPGGSLSGASDDEGAGGAAAAAQAPAGGLGLALQVEVACATPGTLLVFLEAGEHLLPVPTTVTDEADAAEDGTSPCRGLLRPVRGVRLGGRPATWSYNERSCMLKVELPGPKPGSAAAAAAAKGAARTVQVFL